jgi:hypothetical protein
VPDFVSYTDEGYDYLAGVELVTAGIEWPAMTGSVTVTGEDLAAAVTAANDDPHIQVPRLKLGHESEVNGELAIVDPFRDLGDAEPAFGRVVNLRLENDGAVLVGDFVDVPVWLADAMPSAFPNRSAEWNWDVTTPGGKQYSIVVTAIALLGTALPAVQDLEDLQSFLAQGPAALAARTEEVHVPEPTQASVSVDIVRRRFNYDWAMSEPIDELDTYWWWARDIRVDPAEVIADDDEGGLWRVPFTTDGEDNVTFEQPVRVRETYVDVTEPDAVAASVAVQDGQRVLASNLGRPKKDRPSPAASAANQEGSMTPEQIRLLRERLELTEEQLPDDASEEQISAALAAQPEEEAETEEPEAEPAEVEEPVAASDGSTVTVDAEQWQETRRQAEQGAQAAQDRANEQRDRVLDEAVRAGKFAPARRAHWLSLWEKDPDGTRATIASLAEGLIPVTERGTAASAEGGATGGETTGWFPQLATTKED